MSDTMPNAVLDEAPISADEIMKKFDKEADHRTIGGFLGKVIAAIAISFSVFQVYTALFGVFDAMIQRTVHLSFAFCLIYLLYPSNKKWPRDRIHPLDGFLSVVAAGVPLYITIFWTKILSQRASSGTTLDIIIGFIGVLLVLEAARRVVGLPIVIVALVFVAYAFAGPYLPWKFAHRGVTVKSLVEHLFFTTEGIFGTPIRCIEHLHLPLHPLRRLPREDWLRTVLHRHFKRDRGMGVRRTGKSRRHRQRPRRHSLRFPRSATSSALEASPSR